MDNDAACRILTARAKQLGVEAVVTWTPAKHGKAPGWFSMRAVSPRDPLRGERMLSPWLRPATRALEESCALIVACEKRFGGGRPK